MSLKFPAFQTGVVRQPAFRVAGDLALAAWMKLCCQASDYENGGRYEGASTWQDQHWLPIANVTRAGVDAAVAENLCEWDGDTLVVVGYDRTGEKKVRTLRKNGNFGHMGGRPRKPSRVSGSQPRGLPDQNPLSSPLPTLPLSTDPPESREPGQAGSPPPPARAVDAVLMFPVVGDAKRKTWHLGKAELALLREAFPTLDVVAEAKQALLYVQANPAKRKTGRGMMEYLRRWMARVQDRGGSSLVPVPGGARGATPKPAPESFAARDVREREEAAFARLRAESTEREIAARSAAMPSPRSEFVRPRAAQGEATK